MAGPYESHGISITFGTSGFAMNLLDVNPPGIETEIFDTSHQGTTGVTTKMASELNNYTDMTLTVQHDPAIDLNSMAGTEETVTVSGLGISTKTFTGIINSITARGAHRGLMTADVSVTVDGDVATT